MKLYLTSISPINKNELLKLIAKKDDLSVVIVANAWDTYGEERKNEELANCMAMFKDYGFRASTLDLTIAGKQELNDKLKNNTLVWVMGGNTFYLNYYIHKLSFNKVIKKYLDLGLVYGGESAGAAIVGLSLHGIEHLDDPKKSPEIIWGGLKLLDFGIIPHWGWEKYGEYLKKAKEEMDKYGDVVTINNDEALVINGPNKLIVQNPTN